MLPTRERERDGERRTGGEKERALCPTMVGHNEGGLCFRSVYLGIAHIVSLSLSLRHSLSLPSRLSLSIYLPIYLSLRLSLSVSVFVPLRPSLSLFACVWAA